MSAPTLRRDLIALRKAGYVLDEVWGSEGKIVRCNATSIPMSISTAAWLLLTTLFDEVHSGVAEEELCTLRRVATERLQLSPSSLGERLFRKPPPREVLQVGPSLENVLDAVLRDRLLRIQYRAWGAETREVRIAPWTLARLGDRLYVLGPDLEFSDTKWAAWRLDRILSAKVMRNPFSRPPGWDPACAFMGRFGAFHDEDEPVWVTLQLNAHRGRALLRSGLPWLEHHAQDDGEHVRLELLVHLDPAFRQWVLHLGEEVHVLGPPEFREEIRAIYRRLAERYRLPAGKG